MKQEEAMTNYNKLMNIYEVQRAYQRATCKRSQTPRNIRRAIRLQDMAIRECGGDGNFLTDPLPTLTIKEQDFLNDFNLMRKLNGF